MEIQRQNKDTHCVVCELSLFSNATFAPVPQEKRRAERAEQQRVRAEKEKERQARREVCYFQTMKMWLLYEYMEQRQNVLVQIHKHNLLKCALEKRERSWSFLWLFHL